MGLLRTDLLWADATIPYELVNPSANERWAAAVQVAMCDWMAKSEMAFVRRSSEANYLRVVLVSDRCHAGGVGNERKGVQTMECQRQDPTTWSVYAHELAHTIGFAHEHQRPDRNEYVQVDEERAKKDPYDILGPPTWKVFGNYDCESVSHYQPDAALKRRPGGCLRLGTTTGPSPGDVVTVRAAYGLTPAAGLIGPHSALTRAPDALDVFARWTSNAIHTAVWQGTWKGWWPVAPPTPNPGDVIARVGHGLSPPTAVSRTADTVDVFQRQQDDAVVACTWTGSTWTRWRHLNGFSTSAVAASRRDAAVTDIAVRGLDARVWHATVTTGPDGPSAAGWAPIHEVLTTSDVALARSSSGTLHAVVRGVDGAMRATRRPPGGGWSPWQTLTGTAVRLGSTPALVARGTTIDLVTQDDQGRVRGTASHDDGLNWKGWWTIGDLVTHARAALAMVARTPDHLDLVTVDEQHAVHHTHWDVQSPHWHDWKPVTDFQVARATGLALVSRKPGQLDLFAVGMDGRTWTAWWVNPSWGGPRPVKAD